MTDQPISPLPRYRLVLTALWWVWGLGLFTVLALLTRQSAVFSDQEAAAIWEWFPPHLVPTLMLVGAAAYASSKAQTAADRSAIKPLFLIALVVSVVYLSLLTISVFGLFYANPPAAHIPLLRRANLWLAVVQGLSASSLSVFFSK